MIDVLPINEKLVARAIRIISTATNVSPEQAKDALEKADKNVGVAIVMAKVKLNKDQAKTLLEKHRNNVKEKFIVLSN